MADDRFSAANITPKEFLRRFRKALSVPFLLNQVCSSNVTEFVKAYADSLGCSEKTFLFPLLTCTAACMGTNCHIELSNLWHEPPIIWTLVITPRSLVRTDVAEHIKQELLKVQNETWESNAQEDNKDYAKFIFDLVTLEQLHNMLKLNNGYGFGIYNSIRSLHNCMIAPEDTDIMHRLHYGLGWFTDSRVTRATLTKTRVNLSVISTPPVVQQTLSTAPNFSELFYQCFLTACAEESHVKFSQLSNPPETEKLREIFLSIIKLHSSGSIVYKLGSEASEKFGQIHDELTDKAKQMVRKNVEHKIFHPALSYLGRLSCILHVLDNVIESINYKVPISPLTWNTEISATTVWHARELLGHFIEQRHSLMEPIFVSVPKVQRIDLVDNNQSSPRMQQMPHPVVNNSPVGLSPQASPAVRSPVFMTNIARSPRYATARRNLMNNIVNQPMNSIVNQPMNNIVNQPMNNQFNALITNNNNGPSVTPCITSVSSAGIIVASNEAVVNPRHIPQTNSLNPGFNLPSALSVSVSDDAEASQPSLLSRAPYVSILDLSNDDFLKSHKSSIRKVLVHNVGQISPSRCIQLKLIFDPTATDSSQKYSLGFARTFLKKLEKMGFGVCDGAKNGNLRHFLFKKKKFSALTDLQLKMLSDLAINQQEYNKCFSIVSKTKSQNGGVVCLE